MDREEVTKFLGQVPLLQCLPGSSIRRIAEAVQVKHYEPGDYIAREGEPVDGLCIILDGTRVPWYNSRKKTMIQSSACSINTRGDRR
ncbi:acyl-CoA hydrolase 2-like [Triticum urartu]|nr:acyl-CoA hydrolase 2-like [Triticum urartu]